MSLHYQSTGGLQGVVKTNKGIEIRNARLNVKNATPGLGFNGSDELVNEWYARQAGSNVDMGSNKITNLANPSSAQEGATKDYVDSWSTIQPQSDLDMNSNKITNLGAPQSSQDATTKNYVDLLAGTPSLKESLRAYYWFDNTLEDSTTNNYNGTASGSVTFSSGIVNQSAELSGSDLIETGDAWDVQNNDFTISLWYYPTSLTDKNYMVCNSAQGNTRFGLGHETTGEFVIFTEDSGSSTTLTGSTQYTSLNQWYYLVFIRKGSTGYIYVDGRLDKSGSVEGGVISVSGESRIGWQSGDSDFRIDELGVWLRILSDREILHLYNSGSGNQYLSRNHWNSILKTSHINMNSNNIINLGRPVQDQDATSKKYVESLAGSPPLLDMVRAYYSFDGDYKDSTGNQYDGTPSGTSFNNSTAVINQSLEFTSVSDEVTIGDAFAFESGDFSISVWVYPNTAQDSRSGLLGVTGSNNRFSLEYGDNGDHGFRIWTNTTSATALATPNNFPPGQWYHLVVTRTGSVGQLWVDGQLSVQGSVESGDIANPRYTSYLGNSLKALDGFLEECGVWSRVLSEDEILHLYNNGSGNQYLSTYQWNKVTKNTDINMNQNQILNLASAQTNSFTISDDAVQTVSPPNNQGVMMASADGGVVMAFYDVGNGATSFIQQYGSVFNDAGGTDLTGSTGNDGTINISSNSGEIHIENRSGSQTTVRLLNIF